MVGSSDAGGIGENNLVADADTVLAAFDRTAYQQVVVQPTSPAVFARFRDASTSNPQLSVDVKRDSAYCREQLGQ